MNKHLLCISHQQMSLKCICWLDYVPQHLSFAYRVFSSVLPCDHIRRQSHCCPESCFLTRCSENFSGTQSSFLSIIKKLNFRGGTIHKGINESGQLFTHTVRFVIQRLCMVIGDHSTTLPQSTVSLTSEKPIVLKVVLHEALIGVIKNLK